MNTYIIADLHLFDKDQMEDLDYNSFEEMNKSIIDAWNSTVTPDDVVIVMGRHGEGSLEEMKSVISQLNGKLTSICNHRNDNFTPEQWKEIGFVHQWNVSMQHSIVGLGKRILIETEPLSNSMDIGPYDIAIVDETNDIEDNMVEGKLLSADAAKWNYIPINLNEAWTVYDNMKLFMEMDDTTETMVEMKGD